jgi:hypothetical protein
MITAFGIKEMSMTGGPIYGLAIVLSLALDILLLMLNG